jgi:chromatin remodeling complex protein RSC6
MSEPTEIKVKTKKSGTKVKKSLEEKTESTTVTEEPVVAPITVEPVVAPVTVEPVVAHVEPVVEVSVAPVETVIEVTTTVEESNTEILFNKFINQFQDIQAVMKTLHSNLKVLQKEVMRERKESKKKESKIKKKSDKKKNPSGITKPSLISPELSKFLGLPLGELIPRTDVTSKIISYVKENNLQDPKDKRNILPDDKLKELLQPGDKVVSFFTLQTFMKNHFPSSTTETTTPVTTVV